MDTEAIEFAFRSARLKYRGKFSLVALTRFVSGIGKSEWVSTRRELKKILDREVEIGSVELINDKDKIYRFIDKAEFEGYNNRLGLVGKTFVELNVTARTGLIYNKEGLVKCHMCGYIPAHCQPIYNVLVGDEEAEVIICPCCNRVILEA